MTSGDHQSSLLPKGFSFSYCFKVDVQLILINYTDGASWIVQMIKNLPAMWQTGLCPWVKKISWRRNWQSTPVFLPGKSHGQRSLTGYNPWRVGHSVVTKPPYMFKCSFLRCIIIFKSYILFFYRPLCHHVILLSFVVVFVLLSILSVMSIPIPDFFNFTSLSVFVCL